MVIILTTVAIFSLILNYEAMITMIKGVNPIKLKKTSESTKLNTFSAWLFNDRKNTDMCNNVCFIGSGPDLTQFTF